MERTRDLGGCEIERAFELFFSDSQHPFHPHNGAAFVRRPFEAFQNLPDGLWVLNRRRPHRASELHTSD
jgi:hypothetical protein